jgi:4a-hydroxytetrahydrobiopterin dehydratase
VPKPLDDREISDALQNLPGWSYEEDRLTRSYTLDGHLPAVAMLVHVATVQEELNHHADLGLVYNRLTVAVNTHSEGGYTVETVTLVCEKEQVRVLARLVQELLARIDVAVTPDDLDETAQRLVEPVVPAWRAGSLSIGMTEDGERFLLEAEELTDDEADDEEGGATARFWMTREHLVAMAAYAAYAVEAGARDTCRLCNRPIDPVSGHVCPAQNGHGPLTR